MKSVLLCPPTYFDVRDVKNPYMQDADPVDHEKAQDQWEALRRALGDSGLKVETIDPVEDLEDMVFAANQVFVGHHEDLVGGKNHIFEIFDGVNGRSEEHTSELHSR